MSDRKPQTQSNAEFSDDVVWGAALHRLHGLDNAATELGKQSV